MADESFLQDLWSALTTSPVTRTADPYTRYIEDTALSFLVGGIPSPSTRYIKDTLFPPQLPPSAIYTKTTTTPPTSTATSVKAAKEEAAPEPELRPGITGESLRTQAGRDLVWDLFNSGKVIRAIGSNPTNGIPAGETLIDEGPRKLPLRGSFAMTPWKMTNVDQDEAAISRLPKNLQDQVRAVMIQNRDEAKYKTEKPYDPNADLRLAGFNKEAEWIM